MTRAQRLKAWSSAAALVAMRKVVALTVLMAPLGNQLGAQQPPVRPPATKPKGPVTAPATAPTTTTIPVSVPGANPTTGAQPPVRRTGDSADVRVPPTLNFTFDPADSTMRELLDRPGYKQVQYQGGSVVFDALTRDLKLKGKPSAVKRDETMLVGDSITYSDSTKKIVALGDTVWLRDPSRGDAEDFRARGRINYDMQTRVGETGAFSTAVESGQKLYLTAEKGSIFSDTLVSGKHIVYARNGSFTFCDHEEPHFHFTTKDMKFVSKNVMVARPGVLYIGEVPVFWIPFFFQDVRGGSRRTGMLTPQFGIAELLRNSPSYRRSVSNIGYFFAINDYMNAEASFDWRSSARGNDFDPGFVRGNVEYRYRWLNRFITGETAVSYLSQRNGTSNTAITWNHNQDFSRQTRLTSRINVVQSTQVQRATTINPAVANATIRSDLSYQTKIGPAQINLGGNRTQYPGRTQVEMNFPSLSVSSGTLAKGFLSWTPAMRLTVAQTQRIDQGLQFPYVYNTNSTTGNIDSIRFRADRRSMQFSFDTPVKIGDFVWNNSFSVNENVRDYPEQREIIGVRDTSIRSFRVFARTFETNADWTTSFSLPRFFQGTLNVSPSIQVGNVDPASGLWVRTERSGGKFVTQAKRLSYAVSASPTLYGFLPGFGLAQKIRHSISPSVSYSYSPEASVSDAYLIALGRTRVGYLGALKQNRVSLGMATNFEAKLKAPADSLPESGKKINLLALQFSSFTYDFVRADTTGNGLVDRTFSLSGRTDLLPGFDFRANYELFLGDPISDTATFSPYRTDVGISFSLDGKSAIFGTLARLLGRKVEMDLDPSSRQREIGGAGAGLGQSRQVNAAGSGSRGAPVSLPSGGGWRMNVQYNAARQRPPRGGLQILNTPEAQCEPLRASGVFVFDQCVLQAQTAPPTGLTSGQSAIGAPVFISPPTQNVSGSMSFSITPKWSTQWSTQYDVTRARFASQQIGLQRAMHDWNAVFSFTQAPNGNFGFNFFIALKAQPDIKFNYDRQTFGTGGR